MTDPSEALTSFQQAFLEGELDLQRGQIDKSLFVHVDHPNGSPRFTYVRIEGETVTALVVFAIVDPIDGVPCLQVGCAVPEAHRRKGLAKSTMAAGIAELKQGLGRNGISTFYVEAVVGLDNEPSKRVAAAILANHPSNITDDVSSLPALHYVRKV